jgi:hypothetical protein
MRPEARLLPTGNARFQGIVFLEIRFGDFAYRETAWRGLPAPGAFSGY